MRERPILFSAPMVRAILEGRKTQTRRVLKSQPYTLRPEGFGYLTKAGGFVSLQSEHFLNECPCGVLGDRLWVRETWTGTWNGPEPAFGMHLVYSADGSERIADAPEDYVLPKAAAKPGSWVTPLFMPRWASRITLEITEVRAQRLQDISDKDAYEEGQVAKWFGESQAFAYSLDADTFWDEPCDAFKELWQSINGEGSWDANPWVWAVTFRLSSPS